MMSRQFKVRYSKWPPWSLDIPVENGSKLDGVLKDVLGALSYSLKFQFEIRPQIDHQYGSLQPDGNFSGMLGALQKKEVDIAGPFVASEQRAMVTDFTNCLGFSKLGIITGIKSADRNMFLYANVFSWQVWLSLLMTIIGLAFVAALIYNVTVNGWKDDQVSLLSRYFWVFWSYLIGHDGGTTNHWALVHIWNLQSFRILLAAWLLGPVINSLFSFQGSITSTFAITKMRPVIADLDELTKKTSIIPVLSRGSAVQICFMASPDHTHLWKRMKNNMIIFSPETVEETMKKIEKGTHVLIVDYIYALTLASDYVKRRGRCTIQVEELLFCQNFIALGLRKGIPRKTLKNINLRLTYIIQAKLTDRWLNRVFPNYTHCTKQPQEDIKPLSITDILGGFLIWGIGIVCAILLLLTEIFEKRRKRREKKSSSATSIIPNEDLERRAAKYRPKFMNYCL
ncbi:Glutamate receptor ionotropic like protein [Argiope bruennichi]|uniref:Glutamate receptor ionotropic like protein n=1 Tax=Argiope bruennichi TaxID=94029 RepID=A0A8T0G4Y8_ARGBR|nr:Glutamate receptor ionotropic like protein [Argiope bruennichi]